MTVDPRALIAAGAAAIVVVAVAIAVVLNDTPARDATHHVAAPSSKPGPAVPQREAAPAVPESIPTDGVYIAGRTIKTGTYLSPGGAFCYWARLKYAGAAGATVLVDSRYAPGEHVVSIVAGDIFQTTGCREWVMVP